MNDTNINTELLSADAHGRKHIPVAVFAVILVHIILFLVLLIAAGCRAKARAKRLLEENMAQQVEPAQPAQPAKAAEMGAALTVAAGAPAHQEGVAEGSSAGASLHQGVAEGRAQRVSEMAREEPTAGMESGTEGRAAEKMPRKLGRGRARTARASTAGVKRGWKMYVVRSGDTVWKIARDLGTTIQAIKMENNLKDDLLHPGQKLRVSSEKQQKRSNEA